MRFTLQERGGLRILLAEGRITETTPANLQAQIDAHGVIDEIWLRSPGGDAQAGNQAGYIIRSATISTRIPAGWACFSACNFMFMGGYPARYVEPAGQFVVHMFTHTTNRTAIRQQLARGEESAVGLIGEIEQSSAMLATEDADFLVRMGIASRLLSEVMYRQPAVAGRDGASTRRCLTQAEVREYGVIREVVIEDD